MKNFDLLAFANPDELAQAAAAAWVESVAASGRAGQTHSVALSGGRITQKFFTSAVTQAQARAVAFGHVHFFWADERCVPPTDADSNFKMAKELLLAPLNIAADKIHRLRGEDSPAVAVQNAETELRQVTVSYKNRQPVLDLVLLGMGEDGHVASLFPGAGAEILDCTEPFLVIENSPKPPPTRISLSYAAIAAAGETWVIASGAGKEAALRESLKPDGRTPLARVIRSRPVKIFSDLSGI